MNIVQIEPIGISPELQEKLKVDFNKKGHNLIFFNEKPSNDEEIIERGKNADVIILSNLPVGENILRNCPNLKMISVAFAGVDHIDMDFCRKNNILVSNAADYSTHSVAELAIGLIIALYRKLDWAEEQLVTGKDRKGFLGTELFGKTLGVIGLGRIGKKVAEFGKAMGCNVLAYNRSEKNIEGINQTSLKDLLEKSDIVSIHIPLKNDTKGLIGEQEINMMKSSAILINTARGPIVNYEALAKALENNTIAGAGIDVYEKEPPIEQDHPLIGVKNTVLLPHIGFATEEAIEKRSHIVIDNILNWMNGAPQNVVS